MTSIADLKKLIMSQGKQQPSPATNNHDAKQKLLNQYISMKNSGYFSSKQMEYQASDNTQKLNRQNIIAAQQQPGPPGPAQLNEPVLRQPPALIQQTNNPVFNPASCPEASGAPSSESFLTSQKKAYLEYQQEKNKK